jgi:hypothetical protein
MFSRKGKGLWAAALLVCAAAVGWAEDAGEGSRLTAAEIVHRMEQHNQTQAAGLKEYKALRHYQVEYKGFGTDLLGKMDVEVSYAAGNGKTFQIVSQSGSKMLCEKVLRKAVESEKEAGQDKRATALSEANYRFQLAGSDSVGSRPAYVLDVEPITESKFLYRGRIWVDGADFAVVKMEIEPAKSPSFWISRTEIHTTSARSEGFWLPQGTRSETKVRVGGTAVFTIDYGKYEVEGQRDSQ